MKRGPICLLVFIAFFSFSSFAQTMQGKDSLLGVWNNSTYKDTTRASAFDAYIKNNYLQTKPDSAFILAQQLFDFAKKKNLKKFMADALNTQGRSYYFRGKNKEAASYFEKSLNLRKEIGDQMGVAAALNNLGVISKNQGDYNTALEFYNQSLATYQKAKDLKGTAAALHNIGNIFEIKGDYKSAIDYYTKSLGLKEKIKDQAGMIYTLLNIGSIYYNQEDYLQAMAFYQKSLQISQQIQDKKLTANILNNISNIHTQQKEYQKAMQALNQNLVILEEIGDLNGLAATYSNIGNIYRDQGDWKSSQTYYEKSLELFTETNDKRFISNTLINISKILLRKGLINEAFAQTKKAFDLAQQVNSAVEIKDASFVMSEIYKQKSQFKEAMRYFENYIIIKDSLASKENKNEILKQEYRYNYEKQLTADSIKANELQKVQDAILAKKNAELEVQKNRQYMLYGGLFLLLLFLALLYNRFKITEKQKRIIEEKEKVTSAQKEIIEEKHKEKDKLLGILAHDINNRVGGIGSLLELVNQNKLSEEETKNILQLASNSCFTTIDIIRDLLEYARNIGDTTEMYVEKVDLYEFLLSSVQLQYPKALSKSIVLEIKEPAARMLYPINKLKFSRAIDNLIHNAIKFTPEKGKITISITRSVKFISIHIKDSGIGIPEIMQSKIFIPYSGTGRKGTDNEESTGLGLSIVKSIVEKHHGNIWLESKEAEGTTFHIDLPVKEIN